MKSVRKSHDDVEIEDENKINEDAIKSLESFLNWYKMNFDDVVEKLKEENSGTLEENSRFDINLDTLKGIMFADLQSGLAISLQPRSTIPQHLATVTNLKHKSYEYKWSEKKLSNKKFKKSSELFKFPEVNNSMHELESIQIMCKDVVHLRVIQAFLNDLNLSKNSIIIEIQKTAV